MANQPQKMTQAQINSQYMRKTFRQYAKMNNQSTNNYSTGTTYQWDAPIVAGAWAEELVFKFNLSVDYTPAATSPTASLNAVGYDAAFTEIQVLYGNRLITVHPYILSVLRRMKGYNRTSYRDVLGAQSSAVQGILYSPPTLNSGNNNWVFQYSLRLNDLYEDDVAGILPMFSAGTRLQVVAQSPSSWVGSDPMNNVLSTNGGVTVTGTVELDVVYRDYRSTADRGQYLPQMTGIPSVGIAKLQEINPLTAGSRVFQRLSSPYNFSRLISILIDGTSSQNLMTLSNLEAIELDAAESTNSAMVLYDSTNGTVSNYLREIRSVYGQDFGDGTIIFRDAVATSGQSNSSNQHGSTWLNGTSTGYPAFRIGVQAANVGTVCTPRLVTYGQYLDPAGITIT